MVTAHTITIYRDRGKFAKAPDLALPPPLPRYTIGVEDEATDDVAQADDPTPSSDWSVIAAWVMGLVGAVAFIIGVWLLVTS